MNTIKSEKSPNSNDASSIPVTEWIARSSNEHDRLLTLLRIARDLISTLRPRHDLGNFVAGISEASLFIRLPEGTPYLDTQLANADPRSGRSLNEEAPLLLERSVYMAPELSGALQAPIEASTDLYSIGVFLYRAISAGFEVSTGLLSTGCSCVRRMRR